MLNMAKLKESDFYYGAVLSSLLNNHICPALIEGGNDRQVYDFTTDHKDFRLFLKYRSKPIHTMDPDYNSWQFVFSPSDVFEIKEYSRLNKELSIGLVCGKDKLNESQYAVLHKEEILQLFDNKKYSITVSIRKGERAFRISVGGSRENALQVKANILY